jgi:hypothetical protein
MPLNKEVQGNGVHNQALLSGRTQGKLAQMAGRWEYIWGTLIKPGRKLVAFACLEGLSTAYVFKDTLWPAEQGKSVISELPRLSWGVWTVASLVALIALSWESAYRLSRKQCDELDQLRDRLNSPAQRAADAMSAELVKDRRALVELMIKAKGAIWLAPDEGAAVNAFTTHSDAAAIFRADKAFDAHWLNCVRCAMAFNRVHPYCGGPITINFSAPESCALDQALEDAINWLLLRS